MLTRISSTLPDDVEAVATEVIGAAIEVHRALGPGFLERIYLEALCLELSARRIAFERERPIAVTYRGVDIAGQRLDLLVEGVLIIELKAVARPDPIHESKVTSYLRATGLRLGLLINFNEKLLKAGVRRIVV